MKYLNLNNSIKTLSGLDKQNGVVYMHYKISNITISRKYVSPRLTDQNELFSNIMKVTGSLWQAINPDFKREMSRYAELCNRQNLSHKGIKPNGYMYFTGAVVKYQKPFVDMQDMIDVMGETIEEWMERGWLRRVKCKVGFVERISNE